MNRRGFTLVELLAILVILALLVGISVVGINSGFGNAKKKSEDIYLKTLKDAIGVYLDSDGKGLNFEDTAVCTTEKTFGNSEIFESVEVINFNDIINSTYHPITVNDMINPANEKKCNSNTVIRIFRDQEYVYYYSFQGSDLNCLEENAGEIISNLPTGCEI